MPTLASLKNHESLPLVVELPVKPSWHADPVVTKGVLVSVTSNNYGDVLNIQLWVDGDCNYYSLKGDIEVTLTPDDTLTQVYKESIKKNMSNYKYVSDLGRTMGSDPEIFIERGDGTIIPAWKFLKGPNDPDVDKVDYYGDKTKPVPAGSSSADYVVHDRSWPQKVFWDGFQAEFSTYAASVCLSRQLDSIHNCLKVLRDLAIKHDCTARLSAKSLIQVSRQILDETDPKYIALGCAPSLNAYGLKGDLGCPSHEITARSAGGHIHIGWEGYNPLTDVQVSRIVKALDAIVGVACVSMFANFDDPLRRRYYGLPGEYRLPSWGIEYRTLSNAWMLHPYITNLVMDLVRTASAIGYNKVFDLIWDAFEEETVETILFCDVERARKILDRNRDVMLQLLRYTNDTASFGVIRNGIETGIRDPVNFVKNWDLNGGWIWHCEGNHKKVDTGRKIIADGGLLE